MSGSKSWRKTWEEAANQRLLNAAQGEWSPWQAVKMNLAEVPLRLEENEASQGIPLHDSLGKAEAGVIDTRLRTKAYDDAMKYADNLAERRSQAQGMLDQGNRSPGDNQRLKTFLAEETKLPPAWLQMTSKP